MPFGLTNAPAIFQHMMNNIFREFLDDFVVCYLDDILIYSKNPEDHEQHVRLVLQKLRDSGLYAKLEKCMFHKPEVEFLGYIILGKGLSMDPKKIQTILDWSAPSSVRDVQCFLGFANFYRIFIKNYSNIAAPLTKLTCKDKLEWSSDAENAFQALKAAFTTAPILIHPDFSSPFFLETDASDFALGAILSQTGKDGRLHPIAFHSIPRNFLPQKSTTKYTTRSFWPLSILFKSGAIYLKGRNIQLRSTPITKILNISCLLES